MTEARFLRAYPGTTHDQYLDMPTEAAAWLWHVAQVIDDVEAKKRREAEQQQR